ncbi:MAG: hypothetical protein LUQ44_04665 [Methanothrix sp.]|nr:hypothetical protein [Methanothrix sp.]
MAKEAVLSARVNPASELTRPLIKATLLPLLTTSPAALILPLFTPRRGHIELHPAVSIVADINSHQLKEGIGVPSPPFDLLNIAHLQSYPGLSEMI